MLATFADTVGSADKVDRLMTPAERIRVQQEAIRKEAQDALTALLARAGALIIEARDLAEIDVFAPRVREHLNQLASSIETNTAQIRGANNRAVSEGKDQA